MTVPAIRLLTCGFDFSQRVLRHLRANQAALTALPDPLLGPPEPLRTDRPLADCFPMWLRLQRQDTCEVLLAACVDELRRRGYLATARLQRPDGTPVKRIGHPQKVMK